MTAMGWLTAAQALIGLVAIGYALWQLISGRPAAPGREMAWRRPGDPILYFGCLGLWCLLQGASGLARERDLLDSRIRTIALLVALSLAVLAFARYRPRKVPAD